MTTLPLLVSRMMVFSGSRSAIRRLLFKNARCPKSAAPGWGQLMWIGALYFLKCPLTATLFVDLVGVDDPGLLVGPGCRQLIASFRANSAMASA